MHAWMVDRPGPIDGAPRLNQDRASGARAGARPGTPAGPGLWSVPDGPASRRGGPAAVRHVSSRDTRSWGGRRFGSGAPVSSGDRLGSVVGPHLRASAGSAVSGGRTSASTRASPGGTSTADTPVRRRRRGIRLRDPRSLQRRGRGPAAVRRDHRLPGAPARQPPRRRDASASTDSVDPPTSPPRSPWPGEPASTS